MDYKHMFETLAASEKVKIKYKDESLLMKILGKILFFAPMFMPSGFGSPLTAGLGL
jgi:hypothetical protein